MNIEGIVLRDGYKGLELSKVNYPGEIEAFIGGPDDENRRSLGTATLSLRSDGNLWASLALPEAEEEAFEYNPFFGVALANPEEDGTQSLVYLGLSDSNQDPELPPASAC